VDAANNGGSLMAMGGQMPFGPSVFDSAAAPSSPAVQATYTDMLNSLSGAMPDINNGIQSLAYGIGSFAKDPRKREMYIQAALAHQQHMSADKAAHAKVLADQADKILEYYASANPSVRAVLDPLVTHTINGIGALAGKDTQDLYQQRYAVLKQVPATRGNLVATPGPDGKPVYGYAEEGSPVYEKPTSDSAGSTLGKLAEDLKAGRITQAQFDAEYRKETYIAPHEGPAPDRTMVPIYDPSPDNPTHQKLISRDQYAGQPTGSVPQPSMAAVIAPLLAKRAKGVQLNPDEQAAVDMYAQTTPRAQLEREILSPGGPAPAAAAPAAAPAASPTAMPTGQSQDAPLPITNENSVTIVKGIASSGKTMWLQGPDGKVEQVTPEQAKAWLKQHGVE
jgi:hypothetical protein